MNLSTEIDNWQAEWETELLSPREIELFDKPSQMITYFNMIIERPDLS